MQRAASLADDYKLTILQQYLNQNLQRQVVILTQLGQIRRRHLIHGLNLPVLTVKEEVIE